jgi:hypothetical protein
LSLHWEGGRGIDGRHPTLGMGASAVTASGSRRRRPEGPGGVAEAVDAQAVAGDVEIDDHRLQPGEVAHQVAPGHGEALGIEPLLQVNLEAQREETAGDCDRSRCRRAGKVGRTSRWIEREGALDPLEGLVGRRDLGAGSAVLVVSTNLPSSLALRAIAASSRVTLPLAIWRKRA